MAGRDDRRRQHLPALSSERRDPEDRYSRRPLTSKIDSPTRVDSVGERSLRRVIGPFLAILIVINSTIGTGIFRIPAKATRDAGSIGAALAIWVLGGLVALSGALSLAELAAAMPRAGG